jgi:hypothetical protein
MEAARIWPRDSGKAAEAGSGLPVLVCLFECGAKAWDQAQRHSGPASALEHAPWSGHSIK